MKRRGFTLTELAIVLGVIGVLLGSIWTAATMVHQKQQITQATKDVQIIISNIRSLYGSRGSFSQASQADITGALVQAGVFPNDMPISGGYPTSPWGGQVVVWATCCNSTYTNRSFRLAFYGPGLTSTLCNGLLSGNSGPGADSGLIGLVTQSGGWYDQSPLTDDPTAIAGGCALNSPPSSSAEFEVLLSGQ